VKPIVNYYYWRVNTTYWLVMCRGIGIIIIIVRFFWSIRIRDLGFFSCAPLALGRHHCLPLGKPRGTCFGLSSGGPKGGACLFSLKALEGVLNFFSLSHLAIGGACLRFPLWQK